MAIITSASILYRVRGLLDLFYIRERMGKVELCLRPRTRKKKPTDAQYNQQRRFRQGVAWGKHILNNPELKAFYHKKGGKTLSAYQVAVKDRMNPPVITRINLRPFLEQRGGAIVITAKDDCKVASVSLRIFNKHHELLETGEARPCGVYWKYQPRGSRFPAGSWVEVEASDLPGNNVMKRCDFG